MTVQSVGGGRTAILTGVSTVSRLGLAAVWLFSGMPKVLDLNQNFVAVKAYQLLPQGAIAGVANAQPFLEVILGILLLLGVATRFTAIVSIVVFALYIVAIISVWARGLSIDCGCFTSGGAVSNGSSQYPWDIARDLGFVAMAVWLTVLPRTYLSLDGMLGGK